MAEGDQDSVKYLTRAQRCKNLLDDEDMADIIFLVGKAKVPIKANKTMLRHGSSVFYKMFAYSEKEQNVYEVPVLKPKLFRVLLTYFYMGEVDKSCTDVKNMLYAATLYGAMEVVDYCVRKLIDSLNISNCVSTLVLALSQENLELEDAAVCFICKNAETIFDSYSKSWGYFTEEALIKVISKDELLDELKLLKAITERGKKQLLKMSSNPTTLRSVLENLIPNIRFPSINPSDFSTEVDSVDLLTVEEKMAVLLYFNVHPDKKFV